MQLPKAYGRTLAFLALLALLAGCSTPVQHKPGESSSPDKPRTSDSQEGRYKGKPKDWGPDKEIDMSHVPDAVPRVEKRTIAGNKNPYTVLGKTYYLMEDERAYIERGKASWYGFKFNGERTSNGELYDMFAMTGAHKTLPIPSYVRVTNLDNRTSVVVRINDRGPFVGDRIIDLSYVAALKLGMQQQGTAQVEVATITPGEAALTPLLASNAPGLNDGSLRYTPGASTATIAAPGATQLQIPGESQLILLQCGAFGDFANANALKVALLDAGFSDARVVSGQDRLNRVVLGPLNGKTDAESMSQKLKASGFAAPKVIVQ